MAVEAFRMHETGHYGLLRIIIHGRQNALPRGLFFAHVWMCGLRKRMCGSCQVVAKFATTAVVTLTTYLPKMNLTKKSNVQIMHIS